MSDYNEKSVDMITKFFNVFQSLSLEDQKKALLVVEGMSISKQSSPLPASGGAPPETAVRPGDAGTGRVPAKNNAVKE